MLGREYLDDGESYLDPKTRSGTFGAYITFPEEGLRIGGGWFLGVGCSVGVGCWALGVGRWVAGALGVQTRISRRRGVGSRFRDLPWHCPGP